MIDQSWFWYHATTHTILDLHPVLKLFGGLDWLDFGVDSLETLPGSLDTGLAALLVVPATGISSDGRALLLPTLASSDG